VSILVDKTSRVVVHGRGTVRLPVALLGALSLAACAVGTPPVRPAPDTASAVLVGHRHTVTALAVTPDGALLASGSRDGTVRLWALPTGTPRAVLEGHSPRWSIWAAAISPDGKTLASASDDLTVRLWELPSGRPGRVLRGHSESIRALAWSPDGHLLASGSRDETVRVWDPESGEEVALLQHGNTVRAVTFVHNGKTLVSGSAEDVIRLWDVGTRQLRAAFVDHTNTIHALAVTPDGQTLISGSADKTVRLWSLRSRGPGGVLVADRLGQPPTRWERYGIHPGPEVLALAVAPGGGILASAHRSSPLRLWDLVAGREIGVIRSPADTTYAVAFAPGGRWLISGGDDRAVHLWDLSSKIGNRRVE